MVTVAHCILKDPLQWKIMFFGIFSDDAHSNSIPNALGKTLSCDVEAAFGRPHAPCLAHHTTYIRQDKKTACVSETFGNFTL